MTTSAKTSISISITLEAGGGQAFHHESTYGTDGNPHHLAENIINAARDEITLATTGWQGSEETREKWGSAGAGKATLTLTFDRGLPGIPPLQRTFTIDVDTNGQLHRHLSAATHGVVDAAITWNMELKTELRRAADRAA